ncbi:MAG: trypsin-like peptidase domain-containing protein [Planctomycetota bacterium]
MAGLVLALSAGVLGAPPDLYRLPDLRALQGTFADIADRVKPSVVAIRTYRQPEPPSEPTDQPAPKAPHTFGSGVIIRADGLILSNQHVVGDADVIKVVLHNGNEYDARVVQHDVRSDLAVIKIETKSLRNALLGDARNLRVGHWCFAVGNPFGIAYHDGNPAFTVGNVAALGRSLSSELDATDTRYYGDLIETSSPINPGNSGGPLFDIDGQVIGIVTAIVSRSGITEGAGFAIPICERTRRIIDALAAGEPVRYGYLGVEVSNVPPSATRSHGETNRQGALIRTISEEEGPAAKANLQPNDIIVEFAGVAIENADQLVRLVGMTPVGAQVQVRFIHDGAGGETVVTLAERPLPSQPFQALAEADIRTLRWRGALLAEMNEATLRLHRLNRADAGIVVTKVEPDSGAYKAGLKPQDIILRCNGTRVRSLADFAEVQARNPQRIRLDLLGGKSVRLPG